MPGFVLDHGSIEAAKTFESLDPFTQGYIEAMFFCDTGTSDDAEEDLEHATFAELAPETLDAIKSNCTRFQKEHRADLDEALDNGRIDGYDTAAAGRDFWFTRNGHGVGFRDRRLGAIGNTLTDHCRAWGSLGLYRGDDGKLYL